MKKNVSKIILAVAVLSMSSCGLFKGKHGERCPAYGKMDVKGNSVYAGAMARSIQG